MDLVFLLKAYFLGWAVAAPIGPVNLEIIRRALGQRLAAGFCVGLGATMVDLCYMLLTSFGLAFFLRNRGFLTTSLAVGSMLMGWLAWMALRDAWRQWGAHGTELEEGKTAPDAPPPPRTNGRPLMASWLVGLAMTASNPMTLVFWATLPALFFPGERPATAVLLAAAACVWLGALSWVFLLTGLLAAGRRFVGHTLFSIASGLGGAAMAYFALRFVWLAFHVETILDSAP